jgi:hypothetical protein
LIALLPSQASVIKNALALSTLIGQQRERTSLE